MAEQCSSCSCHIQISGFGPELRVVSSPSPLGTQAPRTPTGSILAAPALSLSGAQHFFLPLFCLIPTTTSSPVTSSCIFSLSFPTQESALQPQVPIEAMQSLFSKDMVPHLWTHRNSIQITFLLTDVLIMQVFLTLFQGLSTMTFLSWKARSGQ